MLNTNIYDKATQDTNSESIIEKIKVAETQFQKGEGVLVSTAFKIMRDKLKAGIQR